MERNVLPSIALVAILLLGSTAQAQESISQWSGLVSINEVEINPNGIDFYNQWVEMYNGGDSSIDIGHWHIIATHKGSTYSLPEAVMQPKSYMLVRLPGLFFDYQDEAVALYDSYGGIVSNTITVSDYSDDAGTWQRSPDGSAYWGYNHASPAISNSGARSSRSNMEQTTVPSVQVDKERYFFGDTVHISGIAIDNSVLQIVNSKSSIVRELILLRTEPFEETYRIMSMPNDANGTWEIRLIGDGKHWSGSTETSFEVDMYQPSDSSTPPQVGLVDLHQPHERTLTLNIMNTKTGIITTRMWNFTLYTFGERNVDVSDTMLKKIESIFYTDSFSFTLQNKAFTGKWLHFDVELIGTPPVGSGMDVKFI